MRSDKSFQSVAFLLAAKGTQGQSAAPVSLSTPFPRPAPKRRWIGLGYRQLPRAVRHWTLTTVREKLIKIGAKVVRQARRVIFQMAEVAIPRELFRAILEGIGRLRSLTPLPG